MTSDSTSPPVRVRDSLPREPEPTAGATQPPRHFVLHPLALFGWPPYAVAIDRSPRPPRRRRPLLRRKRER